LSHRENVLIVEDEDEWRKIYQRAVGSQASGATVSVATDLASAERLIDAIKFAVAFVDVGLDVSDDRNVDGLRVMEKIRSTGDETSIVVVTGRSGQDVLKITRDAIKKHRAYDTVGKSSVEPTDIKKLLEGGLQEYRSAVAAGLRRRGGRAHDALRGDADAMGWDHQVMRAIEFSGDVGKLYDFLDSLVGAYLPIVPRRAGGQLTIDPSARLVFGDYWSRAIAEAVLVSFGAAAEFEQAMQDSHADAEFRGNHVAGDPVQELDRHGVKGAVFRLAAAQRTDFG
jgi:ActR/RegA family two-component response regulator